MKLPKGLTLKHKVEETPPEIVVETLAPGITRSITTHKITERSRDSIAQTKVDAMKTLIDVTANEDLDGLFLAMLMEAEKRGYRLINTPQEIIRQINVR